jgi:protein-glutamine gamma-glutamyltransferase
LNFKYRMRRSKKKDDQIFYTYQATTYYLHQCGIERFHQTMYQYATKAVDPAYQLGLTAFMNIYLKHKYANQTLSDQELQLIRDFYDGMRDKLHSKISRWKRVQAFMNLPRYFRFFGLTEEDSL